MAEIPNEPSEDSKPSPGPPLSPRRPSQRFVSNRQPPCEQGALPTDLHGHIADLVNSVKALSSRIGPQPAEPPADEADPRSRHSRIAKKFHRAEERLRGPAATPPELAAVAEAEASTVTDRLAEPAEAAAPAGAAPVSAQRTPVRRRSTKGAAYRRQHPVVIWVAAQAFGFGLVALGFIVGLLASRPAPRKAPAAVARQPATPPPRAAVKAPDEVSDSALAAVDTAMAALHKGDVPAAVKTFEDAQQGRIGLPALDYHLALLAVRAGHLAEAEVLLARANAGGEEPVAVCYVRAMFAGAKGNYRQAAREFETASRLAPFDSKCFFYWGEALRRLGQTRAALDRLQEAIERPASVSDAQLYVLKRNLAQLEVGHATEVETDLAGPLRAAVPPPEILVSAAASALQAADYPAATQFLARAARQMAPAQLSVWLQDYFFQPFATRKEIAPYLHPATAAGNPPGPEADPSAWTAADGDPATWPSIPVEQPSAKLPPLGVPKQPSTPFTPPPAVPPKPATSTSAPTADASAPPLGASLPAVGTPMPQIGSTP